MDKLELQLEQLEQDYRGKAAAIQAAIRQREEAERTQVELEASRIEREEQEKALRKAVAQFNRGPRQSAQRKLAPLAEQCEQWRNDLGTFEELRSTLHTRRNELNRAIGEILAEVTSARAEVGDIDRTNANMAAGGLFDHIGEDLALDMMIDSLAVAECIQGSSSNRNMDRWRHSAQGWMAEALKKRKIETLRNR